MSRNRKILCLLLLAAIFANGIFFYLKTRPPVPSIYLEFAFSIVEAEHNERVQKAISLNPDGNWSSANGQPADLLDALIFALPNTDSVDYSVVVKSRNPPTLGDAIRISRSLASNGICNFTFLENVVPESRTPNIPPLTVSDYTLKDGGKLARCKTSPEVLQRIRIAKAEFDRQVKARRENSDK